MLVQTSAASWCKIKIMLFQYTLPQALSQPMAALQKCRVTATCTFCPDSGSPSCIPPIMQCMPEYTAAAENLYSLFIYHHVMTTSVLFVITCYSYHENLMSSRRINYELQIEKICKNTMKCVSF